MNDRTPSLSAEAWLLIAFLSLPWGGTFVFLRILGGVLPSLTIVLARVGIAGLVLWALLRLRGGRLELPWGKFLVMALLNNVIPFTLLAWAETRIDSGTGAILNATTPLCTALVLRVAGVAPLTPGRIAGISLGLAGVAVMMGIPGSGALGGTLGGELPAKLACVGAALCYGLTALWSLRLPRVPALAAAAGQCLCSTLVLLPLVALIDQPWRLPAPSPGDWAALLGIALLSTALAYVVFFRILAIAGAANGMLVTLLVPVSAMGMGAAFLGEHVGPASLAGAALIGAGLVTIDGRLVSLVLERMIHTLRRIRLG